MRNISFSLTTPQFIAGTKDVTRRLGWTFADVGMELCAVEKSQGLKKGEKVVKLGTIVLTGVRREPLREMLDNHEYGVDECRREGFPDKTPKEFVEFFCEANKCRKHTVITRIEFKKVNVLTDSVWCRCGNPSGNTRVDEDSKSLDCLDCGGALCIG